MLTLVMLMMMVMVVGAVDESWRRRLSI